MCGSTWGVGKTPSSMLSVKVLVSRSGPLDDGMISLFRRRLRSGHRVSGGWSCGVFNTVSTRRPESLSRVLLVSSRPCLVGTRREEGGEGRGTHRDRKTVPRPSRVLPSHGKKTRRFQDPKEGVPQTDGLEVRS